MNTILLILLTALRRGLIGTYFSVRFVRIGEYKKKKEIQNIAIKALGVIENHL